MDQLYDTEPGQPRVPLRATADGYLLVQIAGGGGGGGSSVTNLSTTVSPTSVVVASDTGTDATIPLATSTNAGVMPPGAVEQLAGLGTASTAAAGDFASASHTHSLLMTADERTKLGALPVAADLTTSLAGKMENTLPAMKTAFDAGTAPEKAAFQSSVSGDCAKLNSTQRDQQAAGATTALLSADKLTLLDPGGGPAISIRRYTVVGTLAEVLAVTGSPGDTALVTNMGYGGAGVELRWGTGWVLAGNQTLAFDNTVAYAAASTSRVITKQILLPAGFASLVSGLKLKMGWQKSGGNINAPSCGVHIGGGGTTSDTAILSGLTLSAANRSIYYERSIAFTGADTVSWATTQSSSANDLGGSAQNSAYPSDFTVNSQPSDTYVSLSMQLASTADRPGAYLLHVVGVA